MAYKDDDLNDHLEDKRSLDLILFYTRSIPKCMLFQRLKKSWTENKQVINQTTSFIKVHSRPKKGFH